MLDIFTSGPSFQNHLCAPKIELLLCGRTPHRLSVGKQRRLNCGWKGFNQLYRKCKLEDWFCEKGKTHRIKAATVAVEPEVSILSEDGLRNSGLQFESNLQSRGFHSLDDDSLDIDEKEKLRRMRISKANMGNIPWNKGRRHSPETLQLIRERTKMAMQDPKVKMKLMNLGHAQSEETRIKIGAGVRDGWQRRREMLMVQESCLFSWQNMIAEASRKGYGSEDELQWDSYKVIDEQLKKEWLESIEKRKTTPRLKGSKRAPKSVEQRRKISEAIFAKWADPEYRGRVCSALSKYHGVPVGVEGKRRRRRPSSETSSVKRENVQRKPAKPKDTECEAKTMKKGTTKRRRNDTPSYKDPMASSKLEMIRKIRTERAAMENKKKEAIERAKLLIAEAEKAAKALEVAALKSPLAQASLIESRKLIAEATRSIESIESGQLQLQSDDSGDEDSVTSAAPLINHYQSINKSNNNGEVPDGRIENGSHFVSSDEKKYVDFHGNRLTLPKINGFIKHVNPQPVTKETSKSKEGEINTAAKAKKWVCGKLVEVDD